jgi:hypothetical protein
MLQIVRDTRTPTRTLGHAHRSPFRAADQIDHEPNDRDQRDPGNRSRARERMRQLEERHRERQQDDVPNELEETLQCQRRENLRALHVRGPRNEDHPRRLATVRDEDVVEASAGNRRLESHPERRRANRTQEDPPPKAFERERKQIHQRR